MRAVRTGCVSLVVVVGAVITSSSDMGDLDLSFCLGNRSQKVAVANSFQPFAEKWIHVSETTAIVYWQTGEHARDVDKVGISYVEYGPTEEYGRITEEFSLPPVCEEVPAGVRVMRRASWSQFHRLTGLTPDRIYHYRMVHVGQDGTIIKSHDMTFRTNSSKGTVRITGDPPFVLDRPDVKYVLTKDVRADGIAFEIQANNVTLDLDGHNVTYGQKAGDETHGACTLRWLRLKGVRILNGTIQQGNGCGRACLPVMLRDCSDVEISGLSVLYSGKDGQGILLNWGGVNCDIHHNVVYDKGTETTSRHQQINAIGFPRGGTGSSVHHNIIMRCRQSGIGFWGSDKNTEARDFDAYNNMIYMGSSMTNSMGLAAYGLVKDFKFQNNRIYGRGEMPQCIAVLSGASFGQIFENYGYARSTGKVSTEYDATSSLSAAFRACWGPHHLDVYENTFVTVSGRTNDFTGNARCFWAACSDPRQPAWETSGEINVHDNKIVALVDETDEGYARAVTVCGSHEASARGLVFAGNTVASNRNCVVLSENYGCGSSDVEFLGNTFIRVGNHPGFLFLSCGFWDKPTTGSVFIDSRFEGETGYESIRFSGSAERDFSVGWTLTIQAVPDTGITVQDRNAKEVFSGVVSNTGVLYIKLVQYVHKPEGKVLLTPHTVTVYQGDTSSKRRINMNKKRTFLVSDSVWTERDP